MRTRRTYCITRVLLWNCFVLCVKVQKVIIILLTPLWIVTSSTKICNTETFYSFSEGECVNVNPYPGIIRMYS